jgi:hypothetical protein
MRERKSPYPAPACNRPERLLARRPQSVRGGQQRRSPALSEALNRLPYAGCEDVDPVAVTSEPQAPPINGRVASVLGLAGARDGLFDKTEAVGDVDPIEQQTILRRQGRHPKPPVSRENVEHLLGERRRAYRCANRVDAPDSGSGWLDHDRADPYVVLPNAKAPEGPGPSGPTADASQPRPLRQHSPETRPSPLDHHAHSRLSRIPQRSEHPQWRSSTRSGVKSLAGNTRSFDSHAPSLG